MYNSQLIELYTKTNPQNALRLAQNEVENRATPNTYSLLAYAQLKMGEKDLALSTIENFVAKKTSEPLANYYAVLIYKANGMAAKSESLKSELQKSAFELGPLLMGKIENL